MSDPLDSDDLALADATVADADPECDLSPRADVLGDTDFGIEDDFFGAGRDPLGWAGHIEGDLHVQDVARGHLSTHQQPHVVGLDEAQATRIDTVLREGVRDRG